MISVTDIEHSEIERRKEIVRRVWNYQRVDHIPIGIWLDDFSEYTLREQCEDGFIQFKVNIKCINKCLRCLPDDYIPYARVWPGYMTIATMFGLDIFWSDDPNQAPGVKGHLIDDMEQVYKLKMPNPKKAGLMPHNLRWLEYFSKNLPKDVYLTGIDMGGPMNTAKDLIETNLLYTAFYDNPKEYHYFLKMVTNLQIQCYDEFIKAVDNINRLTCIDFDPLWAPEGRKGFVADDVCASYGPDIFRKFSMPYNNKIFRKFGGGRIHNCGPNPSIHLYLHHKPEIKGLNCSYQYTKVDLAKIKKEFRSKGIVEFNFDNNERPEEIIKGYEEIVNILSPDVIAIPLLFIDDLWSDEDISDIYQELRKISEKYASEIRWNE